MKSQILQDPLLHVDVSTSKRTRVQRDNEGDSEADRREVRAWLVPQWSRRQWAAELITWLFCCSWVAVGNQKHQVRKGQCGETRCCDGFCWLPSELGTSTAAWKGLGRCGECWLWLFLPLLLGEYIIKHPQLLFIANSSFYLHSMEHSLSLKKTANHHLFSNTERAMINNCD
jgi:hypothetical protein